jgi:hypothetical protein
MASSVIIIRDHVQGHATNLTYTADHKAAIEQVWKKPDGLLLSLQHQAAFCGRARYCDLDPYHFRVLLALHLMMLADVSEDQRLDPKNLTMRSLDWILIGLLFCLESRTQGEVSMLTINRVTDENVLYDVVMNLEPMAMPKPKKVSGLRVILDNEKA